MRVSGRIYETVRALIERRPPLDLYHTAVEVHLGGDRYVIENAWPSPDSDTASRGVVVEGPVWSPHLGRFRVFRYEVRRWRTGIIPDASEAVATQTLSTDAETAQRLLDLAEFIPVFTWGRQVLDTAEMWNSNSVIAYLLAAVGLPVERYLPPAGGRAPGWSTGVILGREARPPSTIPHQTTIRPETA